MIKEELYKWYDIVDEDEYWTEWETYRTGPKIATIINRGDSLYTYEESYLGWGTMARQGCWKYMRIKID